MHCFWISKSYDIPHDVFLAAAILHHSEINLDLIPYNFEANERIASRISVDLALEVVASKMPISFVP